jgi:hypothetical protein
MTADGTGLITAAFRRNLFIIAPKILISQILPLVLAVKCFSMFVITSPIYPQFMPKHQPNVLSSDGSVSLASASYSRNGKWFAYALSRSGSDFTNVYIRSTENPLTDAKNDLRLSDELKFVKFSSIAWTHDSKGFFYQVRALASVSI